MEFESSTLGLGFRVLSPANGVSGFRVLWKQRQDKWRTTRTRILECFCTHSWIAPNFRLRSRRVWVVILFTKFWLPFRTPWCCGEFFETELCWNAVCWLVGGWASGWCLCVLFVSIWSIETETHVCRSRMLW